MNMADMMIESRDSAVVSPEGRIVIPASVRKALGIEPGTRVTFSLEDGYCVRITTQRRALAKLQGIFEGAADGRSLVDELIAERRAEAALEAGGIS